MMNLFEGVRKMTDDEIRMQIALFRNVTLLNAAKETSGKVLGGLADIANAFAESFSKRTPFDFQVTRVCDMVRKEYDRLKANDRVQLEYELKKILTEKCRELVPEESEEPDEERLSFLIINEAAKVYGIHKYKTPSGKIEAVSTAYNNALLSVLHKAGQRRSNSYRPENSGCHECRIIGYQAPAAVCAYAKGIQRTVHRTYFKTGTFHKVPFVYGDIFRLRLF